MGSNVQVFESSLGLVFLVISWLVGTSAWATPLAGRLQSLGPEARDLLKGTIPAAPRFLAYNDAFLSPFPSASQLSGFNVFALGFLLTTGPVDQAEAWAILTPSQRSMYLQEYEAAGISLIVSAFGSTDTPTTSGQDPVQLADTMSSWVKQYGFQGIDVDYEDSAAFETADTAVPWLISFTQQLRTNLPQGQYILTHAPVAPWFSPGLWSGGGYLGIDKSVGDLIDWYNVQFYNQGTTEYTTCDGLLTTSSATFPQSALFQIAESGVPLDKLLIGKPGTASDASNGFMSVSTLASCAAQAFASNWSGGIMVWEFPHVGSSWIAELSVTLTTNK